jgi:hypothetical protein
MAKVTKTPALLVVLSLVAVVTIMIGNTTTQVIQQWHSHNREDNLDSV